MISTVGFNIYAMVSLEQTISRNNIDPGERDWTFGQVLAMFMLEVAYEFLNFVLAHLDKRGREAQQGEA